MQIGKDVLIDHRSIEIDPVLIVSPWYRPTVGGIVEIADRLFSLLNKNGIVTHLMVCEESVSPRSIEPFQDNKNIWQLEIPSGIFFKIGIKQIASTIIRGIYSVIELRRFIVKYNIRSVILVYPISYSWIYLILKKMLGYDIISSVHGNDILKYSDYPLALKYLLKKVYTSSNIITVPAVHLRDNILELFPGIKTPIKLIPNAINTCHFIPPPDGYIKKRNTPTILHVSNFNPKKRTSDIVEGFALAKLPDGSQLVMVGDGKELREAKEKAIKLGVENRIVFTGSENDVRPYYWDADLLLMSSDEESGPLALLEAMACGIPWISTNWGVASMIPPDECGIIIPERSPVHIAAAIEKLVCNPELRMKMGRRGRDRAVADFGMDKYIESHIQLLLNIKREKGISVTNE